MTSSRRRWLADCQAAGRLWLVAMLLASLSGCAQPGRPPVAERSPVFSTPSQYTVRTGDTVYSIAWRFGLDYRDLARANGIPAPYTIRVGQQIRLAVRPPVAAGSPRAELPRRDPPGRAAPPAGSAEWRAPTRARVKRAFGDGNRGIDYELDSADRVQAAAAGEVVYAGNGLGGYRYLVIIKHDPEYLSAYSMDRPPAVREGEWVKAGATLADNLSGGRRAGTLHFEIRKDGDPVNPRPLIGSG